jgi:hypothetical protein
MTTSNIAIAIALALAGNNFKNRITGKKASIL